MAAHHNVNPNQLSMLMPAHQLFDMPSLDASGYGGDVSALRRDKRQVNRIGKLPGSIAKEGIRKPVQIAHGVDTDPGFKDFAPPGVTSAVSNGNHRLIAAYDHDPNMEVPVEHFGDSDSTIEALIEQDRQKW